MFVIAGTALLLAAVLVPTADDLSNARWQLNKALAMEAHALERINRHEQYLASIERADPDVAVALAGAQLNLVPTGMNVLAAPGRPADLDLFAAIEPAPPVFAPRNRVGSVLERMVMDPSLRLWVIAGSAILLLTGLLPASRPPSPGI